MVQDLSLPSVATSAIGRVWLTGARGVVGAWHPMSVEEFVIQGWVVMRRAGGRLRRKFAETRMLDVTRAVPLDGIHVWITFAPPTEGVILATDVGSGRTTAFSPMLPAGPQTALLPLADLPGADEGRWLLQFCGGGRTLPLRCRSTMRLPTKAAPSPDEKWHYQLEPVSDRLELRRIAAIDSVPVSFLGADGERMTAAWPSDYGAEAVLVNDDAVVVALDVTREGERAVAAVDRGVVMPAGTALTVAVAHELGHRPLRRTRNDLHRPDDAVLMPEVGEDDQRVRLAWSDEGLLQVVWGQ